jgi:hypothetical protein
VIHCILLNYAYLLGTRERSLLRHYSTCRKVAGSIPDEVIGVFNSPNTSGLTVTL